MSASREKKQRQDTLGQGLTQKQIQEQKEAAAKKRNTIAYTVIGVVVVVLVAALLIWNSGFFQARSTAVSVNGRNYTPTDVIYYYANARSPYQQYGSLLGYDASKSDKEQIYDADSGQTYHDYFLQQAMSALIQQASENDNISTLFVSDQNGVFCGAIDLKELIIARPDTEFSSLIRTSYPYVYGHESIDDCIEQLKDYSEDLIPVLDNQNRLLGAITAQSIIQVVDDEMGEDYAMLAGLTAEEDLAEPLGQSMKKRLPWLFVLLALGLVVSSVVGVFEQVVSQLPLIMSFQSLILDMAGNVGTQSLAVTIRVLMDENLTARQKFGLVVKEMRIGFANGLLLGAASFGAIGLFIWVVKGKGLWASFAISGCIGVSLLLAMVISSAVGTLIPLFFKKIHVDPAVASGPLITTVNDLVAVVSYYGLSWILLLQVMHLAG